MIFGHPTLLSLALLAGSALSVPPTCNDALHRDCWTDGFDIKTDYEAKVPQDSGNTTAPVKVSSNTASV